MQRIRIFFPLFLALTAFGQDVKPNFTGMWRRSAQGHSPNRFVERIEQTNSTIAITTIQDGTVIVTPRLFPTDGHETKMRRNRLSETRTGHWEGTNLILESTGSFPSYTGPHHGPWTTRWVLSLSNDGKTMKMSIRSLGDKDHRHDSEIVSEKIVE